MVGAGLVSLSTRYATHVGLDRGDRSRVERANADAGWMATVQVANRQSGVVTREQLLIAGLSGSRIERLLARGILHRLHRGIYSLGHTALGTRGRLTAAVLRGGGGSMLGGPTASWWFGVIPAEPAGIHILAPGHVRSGNGLVIARAAGVKQRRHRGMPVCSIGRALIDTASSVSLQRLRRAISETLYKRLATVADLEAELRPGLKGSAAVRGALERHRVILQPSRSELEESFFLICERAGVPLPRVNQRVGGFEIDFYWPELRLAVEIDGPGHAEISRQAADRRREMALRAAGIDVIRYVIAQVTGIGDAIASEIRREVALRSPR